MKNSVLFLFSFVCLFFACKKDNPVVEEPNLLHLTFTGTVVNQETQAPVANVPVHVIYGTACCGTIENVKGSDSTTTDSQGKYTIQLTYAKGTSWYRHFVYVPGTFSGQYYINQATLKLYPDWITTHYEDSAIFPFAPSDTTKLVDGNVSTANIEILPASTIKLKFPYSKVPATDSIYISALYQISGQASPRGQAGTLNPNTNLNTVPSLWNLTVAANNLATLTIKVYHPGTGELLKTLTEEVTLNPSQVYEYQVNY